MLVVTVILCIVLGALIAEKLNIQRSVNTLPLRIHVNGTRGKSSVTEYIGAGLLSAQYNVIAKVTGVIPTIFFNGSEQIINRTGAARLQEQLNIIRMASKRKVKGLVMECMSVSPEFQKIESSVFRPHIYVITNIRDDHREHLGQSLEEQADHISGAIPEKCTVITNEIRFLDLIKEKAASKNSNVISVKDLSIEPVENLSPGVIPENLYLALAVCDAAHIDHNLAREGMLKWTSKVSSPYNVIKSGVKEIRFLNAFPANDIESTEILIGQCKKDLDYNGRISLIFNSRSDRPLRTQLFAGWIAENSVKIEHVFITGDHSRRAKLLLVRAKINIGRIHILSSKNATDLKSELMTILDNNSLVVGIGNIGGTGFQILHALK